MVTKPQGVLAVEAKRGIPARYVAELDLTMRPEGTSSRLAWRVSFGDAGEHVLVMDTEQETVHLIYSTETGGNPLSQHATVLGLLGRDVRVGFAKDGTRYAILVDGATVAQGTDERLSPEPTTFLFRLFEQGTASIRSLRVYAVE